MTSGGNGSSPDDAVLHKIELTSNPFTGQPWQHDDLDDMQFGVTLYNGNVLMGVACHYMYIELTTAANLTVSKSGNGTVTPTVGTHVYDTGTDINITAQPDSGWEFVNWTGDVATIADPNAASTTITMNGSYSIQANFVKSLAVTTNAASGISFTGATLNGNLTGLGTATTIDVSFEWGTDTNYGNTTTTQQKTATGTFNDTISGLTPNTTYHFRAKAEGNTTVYGSDQQFTTLATTPTVSTNAASGVTTTGATLNGNLTGLGSATTVNVSFEWGLTTSYGNTTTSQPKTATGTFNASLSGLTPGTTYHFRAKAVGNGTSYGSDQQFTTLTTPPSVSSSAASGITMTGATLNGNLTGLGTATTVNVSFEWGLTTSYGNTTTAQPKTATGTFSDSISGLSPNTTYHFRAKAVGDGTSYGSDQQFTTVAVIPPSVTTNAATNITTTTATLNGNLTSLGNATTVQVYFEWGLTTSYGNTTTQQQMSSTGVFSANLSGLTKNKTYHFRAVAIGNGVTVYGNDLSFTTPKK